MSAAAASLVDVPLRDLGEHRFKDLRAPERVFQLGDQDFPAIRSLYRSNLPVPASSFLGRDRELGEIVDLLGRDGVRLVTLTGPCGTGKTRLALQAAAEVSDLFPDGAWWVGLASLRDPALVLSSVAQVLGVKEKPSPDLADTLVERLGGKRALVLLDNAEHLLPNLAAALSPLVRDSGTASFLVTSRERLQVTGEHVYAVPELAANEGVELFLARAGSAGVELDRSDAVAGLCARLDQLPLALELAAARTVVFAPTELLERLGKRLDLLKGGRDTDPRQQTLRATIEWSCDTLDEAEQRLFRQLSVFVGGCTYEAAEQVAGADPDTLQSLLDKSLLRRPVAELSARYWMLETVHEYAGERLAESADHAVAQARHADHFAARAHGASRHMGGSSEKRDWVARLDPEEANIRAALEHISGTRSPEALAELVVDLGRYWYLTARGREGHRWFAEVSDRVLPPELRVRVDAGYAIFASQHGEFEHARRLAERSVYAWRTLPDRRGISDPLATLWWPRAPGVGCRPRTRRLPGRAGACPR